MDIEEDWDDDYYDDYEEDWDDEDEDFVIQWGGLALVVWLTSFTVVFVLLVASLLPH